METKITSVIEKSGPDDYPLIVSFQNGVLKSDQFNLFQVKLSSIETSHIKRKRLILTQNNGPSYAGDEEILPVRSFLVERNKSSSEASLVEIGKVNLKNTILEERREIAKAEEYDDYSNLMVNFGSKRAKRALQQQSKLNFSLNTNNSSLTEIAQEMVVEDKAASDSKEGTESLLSLMPPCDRNAKDKSEVYNLSEFLGNEVLDWIAEFDTSSLKIDELGSFTRQLVPDGGLTKLSKHQFGALIMIDDMIKFLNIPAKKLTASKYVSEHSAIHYRIIDLFCTKSGSRIYRPPTLRDKTIAYCLAMSLVVGKYDIPLDKLSGLIRISMERLKIIGRAVGGTAKSDRLILKLPLPSIPLPRRSKAKD